MKQKSVEKPYELVGVDGHLRKYENRSIVDSWNGNRQFWTVETIRDWLKECEERRQRLIGKHMMWGEEIVEVYFSEPGLVPYVLVRDENGLERLTMNIELEEKDA